MINLVLTALLFPAAQLQVVAPQALPAGTVIKHAGTWSASTGFVPATNSGGSARGGSELIYSCDGLFSWGTTGNIGTGGAWQDWMVIDDFKLKDRNRSETDQVSSLTIAYCTDVQTTQGGYGEINFYNNYTPCATLPPPVSRISMYNLPMSSSGNLECWSIDIDLTGGGEVPNDVNSDLLTENLGVLDNVTAIGIRFDFAAITSQGMMGPLIGGTNGYGNSDNLGVIDLAGNNLGCVNFSGNPFASIGLSLFGPPQGTKTYYHQIGGGGQRPDFLLRNRKPIIAGQLATWRAFDLPATTQLWLAAAGGSDDIYFSGLNGSTKYALIQGPLYFLEMGNGDTVIRPIPLALAGRDIFVQAVATYGVTPFPNQIAFLSNGLRHEL